MLQNGTDEDRLFDEIDMGESDSEDRLSFKKGESNYGKAEALKQSGTDESSNSTIGTA